MDTLLDEIENMILAGNERAAQRENLMKSALIKMGETYSAMKKPSQVLKIPDNIEIEESVDNDIVVENDAIDDDFATDTPLVCSCGKPWIEGARFCNKCGAEKSVIEVIDKIICPNGHECAPGAKFCRVCGAKIE